MGCEGIDDILPITGNEAFRKTLETQKEEYKKICDEADRILVLKKADPEDLSAMAKMGSKTMTMMKTMKERGIATSLDMTSVDPNSPAGAADWDAILKAVLPYVDFFVPSVEELCYMLDRERYEEWQVRAAGKDIADMLDLEKDIKPLADKCMTYGCKVLLIKCGAPGMYYRTAGKEELEKVGAAIELDVEAWADKDGFERSYVPEKILSGTGAGDTSIAAFLTAILEGCGPEESMQLATATGASCVAAYDALSGLKSFDQLRAKIAAGWNKN